MKNKLLFYAFFILLNLFITTANATVKPSNVKSCIGKVNATGKIIGVYLDTWSQKTAFQLDDDDDDDDYYYYLSSYLANASVRSTMSLIMQAMADGNKIKIIACQRSKVRAIMLMPS